jgi:FkbM family methyltransferase
VGSLPRPLRRHRMMTGWMRLTGEDPLQLVRVRDKAFAYADMSDSSLRLIVIDGRYDQDFFRIADMLLAGGGEFFDVGANYGLLSFGLAGNLADRVRFHLFEPVPRLVRAIRRTLKHYPAMQATVNAAAVADYNGEVTLAVPANEIGRSHINPAGSMHTLCVKLDSYLAQPGMADIDLIKLDAQGYELPALRGAAASLERHAIKAIYLSYSESNLSRVGPPEDLIRFLDDVGYATCLFRDGDLVAANGPTHTLADGLPGHGLPLTPVLGRSLPAMTDLFAAPKEHIVTL